MDYSQFKNQRVIIELKTGRVYEANFETVEDRWLKVDKMMELPHRNPVSGQFRFFLNEITDIRLLLDNVEEVKDKPSYKTPTNIISIESREFERLKDVNSSYVYMATIDKRYLDAVDHLWNCDNIGVVGLGSNFGRINSISLLVLSSWNRIYIFDILLMNRKSFPIELKTLLESKHNKKIVHNSQPLVDCLFNCHTVNMQNIFDTQVADIVLQKKTTENILDNTRSLGNCLKQYFNFPISFLESAENIPLKKWSERPLTALQKTNASLLATYLITLKNKLEKLLLKDFYDVVDAYSHELVNCNTFQVQMKVTNTELSDNIRKLLNE